MTSNSTGIGDQMQAILDLMTKRSKGEATNQEVEAAASQIISVMGGSKPKSKEEDGTASKGSLKKRSISGPSDPSTFQADTGDYDDDEEDDNNKIQQKQKEEPIRDNKRKPSKMPAGEPENEEGELYQDKIDQIKLGKQGAKMMTTFGDGPRPEPEALTAALLGTRKCLQVALFDARALRRQAKQTYQKARQSFEKRKTTATTSDAVNPNMLYRAFSGYDKLSYDPKCGFDMEQLRHLFPEEMIAYMKWKDLHASYQENSIDENNKAIQGDDEKEEEVTGPEQQHDPAVTGGHLQERAAQFDHRTDRMKSDWYIKFAQVRQGSFLPRGKRHRKNEAESEWDKSRKTNRKRGAPVVGVWETMTASQVQFLHWLGFQPPVMPPPNEETTQALGFLGYDFLGKIVEKAIFLRNLERLSRNQSQIDHAEVLGELRRGEQLTSKDIELAMDDPDIRPVPLHGVEKTSRPSVQLYFGPGFEERLELELEELVAAGKPDHISEEERMIRQKESELFVELAKPPEVLDSVSHLMESNEKAIDQEQEEEEEEEEMTSSTPSKRTRSDHR